MCDALAKEDPEHFEFDRYGRKTCSCFKDNWDDVNY